MPDGIVEIKSGGAIYGGWERAEIKVGIEQVAGTFELEVSERWPGQPAASAIKPGDPYELLINGESVLQGKVDDVEPYFDDATHSITITGRDVTQDLVDCSAIHKSGQWRNCKLDRIAADICSPFGIGVVVQPGVDIGPAFPSLNIQEGERAFETLDRAARMRAVLLMSDGNGNLVIGRAGKGRIDTALVEGVNIKSARGKFSWKERFSHYVVKGQRRGSDGESPEAFTQGSGTADDSAINRYRPLVVLAEDQGHVASLSQRAEWEMNVRMGRGSRATVTVQGWSHSNGIWRHNYLVPLLSPRLYADLDILIASVVYRIDSNGTRCELEVVRPEAFDLLAGVKGARLDRAISDKTRLGAAARARGDTQKWLAANSGAGYAANISTVNRGELWK